ncbi:MAG: signal peptidase II [Dehalococcoidia bacterium]|nr:signal peptidase II [Dehalococcoidia bacterium]
MHPSRTMDPMDTQHTSGPPAVAGAEPLASAGSRWSRVPFFASLVVVVIAADQLSKVLVRGWLDVGESWPAGTGLIRLTRVENPGAAFGILQDSGPFLIVTGLLAIFALVAFFVWAPPQSRLHVTALALVLGGALGNFIDRVVRGTVTDFIDPTNYPSFNLADSAIVTGVVALVVLSLFEGAGDEGAAAGSPVTGAEPERGAEAGRERAG